MSWWRLLIKTLTFYWRTNLGVFLAAIVSTAILVGALLVGDSVQHSLQMLVTTRLGTTRFAVATQNRFFRAKLADQLEAELSTPTAPALHLRGLIANSDGTKRANRIEVLGVDRRFYSLVPGSNPFGRDSSDGIVLNQPLAAKLGAGVGDEVVLRIANPASMPRDVPLTLESDLSISFRLPVKAVATQSEFGRFSLQANQVSPLNAFVSLNWLQEKLGRPGYANLLLAGPTTLPKANDGIRKCFQLADLGLELRQLPQQNAIELRSRRIFIDDSLAQAAVKAADGAVGILTYFANEFQAGDKVTPYSFVSALQPSQDPDSLVPADMQNDEIIINQWLAEDLDVKRGDTLSLSYFVLGPMRKLQQRSTAFRVRDILPLYGPAADAELMPDFPGLANVENCRDWKPGIPIDLKKIRAKDEEYWDQYRGTPKAFVSLKAGQAIWANRYGNLTAIRYPLSKESKENITARLLNNVDPASIGLYFQDVHAYAVRAGDEGTDFGRLFLGFSIFLIAAALVLMGLVFVFGVEKRSDQAGMFLALGFSPKSTRRLFLFEGSGLALLGAIAGAAAALLYTKAMIYALTTVWKDAVTGSVIHFHARLSTVLVGVLAAVAASVIAIWLALRKQLRRPARELLARVESPCIFGKSISKHRIGLWLATVATVGAVLFLVAVGTRESDTAAATFFAAGALLLIALLALTGSLLQLIAAKSTEIVKSLWGLGLRNSTRRRGRSLAVVGLLAAASFLVIAVGANRHDPLAHAQQPDSGTGGFTLFGESAIAILHDLNDSDGRRSLGLDDRALENVKIVQLRVHDGDDASCFNLNRAQRPRLLGLQPQQFRQRRAFGFKDTIPSAPNNENWNLLNREWGSDVVPAIGDYTTVIWALGKSIGDELEYIDEKGHKFKLRLVAILKNSILQGSLIIPADEFVRRFPSEEGYRMFLIDASKKKSDRLISSLSAGLRNFGMELTPTTDRLARFNAVENTYLSIFQTLGGLGLILGSIGLGLVVLRNVLERRGELAMLRAVGFSKSTLKRVILYEHAGLLLAGLFCGVVTAALAVAPALRSPGSEVPYLYLTATIVGIAASGVLWIWIATVFALGGGPLDALRNE